MDSQIKYLQPKRIVYLFHDKKKHKTTAGTWNLHEAGHGKRAADDIGGVLKRTTDRLVVQGSDICDASSFYSLAQSETDKIPLFFVDEIEFETSNIEILPRITSTAVSIKFNNIIAISLQDQNSCKQVNSTLRQTSDETKDETRDVVNG